VKTGTGRPARGIEIIKHDKQHIFPGNQHLLTGWTRDHTGEERILGCLPRITPSLAWQSKGALTDEATRASDVACAI